MRWFVENGSTKMEFYQRSGETFEHTYDRFSNYVNMHVRHIHDGYHLLVNGRKVKPWGQTWVFGDGKGPYGY